MQAERWSEKMELGRTTAAKQKRKRLKCTACCSTLEFKKALDAKIAQLLFGPSSFSLY